MTVPFTEAINWCKTRKLASTDKRLLSISWDEGRMQRVPAPDFSKGRPGIFRCAPFKKGLPARPAVRVSTSASSQASVDQVLLLTYVAL